MKKAVLFVMAVLLLVSSLVMVSCGDDSSDGNNPFVGTWTGTVYSSVQIPGTLKFTGSDWTFTVPSLNLGTSGRYRLGSTNTLAILSQNGSDIGGATISNGTLILSFSSGVLSGYGGQFTK